MAGLSGGSGSSASIRSGRAHIEFWGKDAALLKSLDRIQARFKALNQLMVKAGSVTAFGGGAALTPVTAKFVEFDDAIRSAIARIPDGAKNFERLTEHAKELGRTTSFTATEVAALMDELGTAGYKTDAVIGMTKDVLDLARAAGVTAPEAAGILSASLKQAGLGVEDAGRAVDTLTAAANLSFNRLGDLGEAMKYVGPIARTMGHSLEDTSALLGTLGDLGIRGSEAGTALRRLLTASGAQSADFMRVFNVNTVDATGNVRNLVDILDDVQKSVAGLGNAAKAAKFDELFGLLGITSAVSISENAKSVRTLRDEIKASGGIAAETARQMDAGLGGAFRRLRGATESLVIEAGTVLAPILSDIAAFFRLVANAVRGWVANNGELARTIGGVIVGTIAAGAAIAALGLAITTTSTVVGAITGGISAAVGVVGALLGVVTSLLNPLTLVTVAATAFGTSLLATSEKGKGFLDGLAAGVKEFAGTMATAWEGIVASVKKGDLEGAFTIASVALRLEWEKVVRFWTEVWVDFKKGFLKDLHEIALRIEGTFAWKAGRGALGGLSDVVDVVKGIGGGVGALVDGALGGARGEAAPELRSAIAEGIGKPAPLSLIGAGITPAFGFELGQIIGPAVADAVNEELKKDPLVRAADARIAALRDELAALVEASKKPAPAPAEAAAGANQAPMPREVVADLGPPPRPILSAASTKGAFNADIRQLGYGDSFEKKQLDTLKEIKDGKGRLAEKIGAAVLNGIRAN